MCAVCVKQISGTPKVKHHTYVKYRAAYGSKLLVWEMFSLLVYLCLEQTLNEKSVWEQPFTSHNADINALYPQQHVDAVSDL